MFAALLGFFGLTLIIFGWLLVGWFRCKDLGVNPDDLFEMGSANYLWLLKLAGCVAIITLALLYLYITGHTAYKPLS